MIGSQCFFALISGLVCLLVAFTDLVGRYSFSVKLSAVAKNMHSYFYLAVNFVVGFFAYVIAIEYGWVVCAENATKCLLTAIWVGFGALAVLRTSFASVKVGDTEINIGPVWLLDFLRKYIDRKVNIAQKLAIDAEIAKMMKNVDAQLARNNLPMVCLASFAGESKEEIDDLNAAINSSFLVGGISIQTRSILIGHAIYRVCGIDVLRSGLEQLGSSILRREDESPPAPDAAELSRALAEQRKRLEIGRFK